MKRSSTDSAWPSRRSVQHVGTLELRLLRQQRAGRAALEALVELGGALVAAVGCLFLGL
jgi:hypothetical protein